MDDAGSEKRLMIDVVDRRTALLEQKGTGCESSEFRVEIASDSSLWIWATSHAHAAEIRLARSRHGGHPHGCMNSRCAGVRACN